jgi:3-deoxy-D-manno-octulosonate 8-phosphate phosphatase (KDO 8-P phosphatase)
MCGENMKKAHVRKGAGIAARARRIRAIVSDVDGVLTDGGIIYGPGGLELKRFHALDGLAIKLARARGIKVFLVSGRTSAALARRSRELGVDRLWQGVADKRRVFDIIMATYRLHAREVCAIGDDLPELPLLLRAGLGVAVSSAPEEVRRAAHVVTERPGGEGALREVVELILKARGEWKAAIGDYAR